MMKLGVQTEEGGFNKPEVKWKHFAKHWEAKGRYRKPRKAKDQTIGY